MVVVFEALKTEVPYEDNGTKTMRSPRAFRNPAFVGGVFNGKEFLAVLCDARYNSFADASFIEAAVKTSYGDYKAWSAAEIFAKNTRKSLKQSVMGSVTAVMKGNKIFALATSWDELKFQWFRHGVSLGWNPLMILGTVTAPTESNTGGVSVRWEDGKSLKDVLSGTVLGAAGYQFIGGVGNGVITKNGAIVFPIQIAKNNGKTMASIMYSTDEGSTWKIGGATEEGPSEGSVVEWGDGKLLLVTRYDREFRKAYESEDMGTTWKESTIFSRVWGNRLRGFGTGSQGSVITAPVDGKDVLLFSHPLNKKGRQLTHDTLQLWLSDGQRIVCVGKISEDGKGERTGNSILGYVGKHLYGVHEINPRGITNNYNDRLQAWDRVIAISPLPHFFESVKHTVRAWRKLDAELQRKYIPTDALVGFLGEGKDDAVWADGYNCVNATVHGATRVPGGFRFDAQAGSGAQWPVQSQKQNQIYSFTRDQFTIAATVKIHAINEKTYSSLLGASRDAEGYYTVLELGYTQDRKWYVDSGRPQNSTLAKLELEKEYHVALTFAGDVSYVYVDGVSITNEKLKSSAEPKINHFYAGGIGKSSTIMGTSCTVKNVMLSSRALSQEEVDRLSNVDGAGKLKKPKSTTQDKETSAAGSQTASKNPSVPTQIPNKDVDHFTHENRNGTFENDDKGDNAAVVSLSFAACMCLVYSALVLTWL